MLYRLFMTFTLLIAASMAQARSLTVLSDIAPVNVLVQAVAKDLQHPTPLIELQQSAHDFALRPSDIGRLGQADLIIWLGPQATPALAKLMATADLAAKSLDLSAIDGVNRLGLRKSGLFSQNADRPGLDPHLWLDPANAILWTGAIASALGQADPDNSAEYQENAAALIAEITQTSAQIRSALAVAPPVPFVQYHDGFQYFETAFGLSAIGSATAEDEESTSLGVISALREALAVGPRSCVFTRDAAQTKRAAPLLEIPGSRRGALDPIGRNLPDAAFTYPALLQSVAAGYLDCFTKTP